MRIAVNPCLLSSVLMMAFITSAGYAQPAVCVDECLLGQSAARAHCELWDQQTNEWRADLTAAQQSLHQRARAYLPWLRQWMSPAGGVMNATFTDDTYSTIAQYGGERDAAMWTGVYLAAEALRYLTTGAPDALTQLNKTADVLHRWWNISGDPGYLARYAAPSSSKAVIKATLPNDDREVVHNWLYDGVLWDWRGAVSRDQYQGVLLGYALAYDATTDPVLRAQLRADVTAFALQLLRREQRSVQLVIDDTTLVVNLALEQVVYSTPAMTDGMPTLTLDIQNNEVTSDGMLIFWSNPSEYLRQIPALHWLPDMPLATQALQLGAVFSLALYMTHDVPEYAAQYAQIAAYYDAHVPEWLNTAAQWRDSNWCGNAYHGLNIAFMPLHVWLRTEMDGYRRQQLQTVLTERLWPAVQYDKNVWFAFIYAADAPAWINTNDVVATHVAQLTGFPAAPNRAIAVDVRDQYWENPVCNDLAAIAIDVNQRAPATFLWERQPWKRRDDGVPYRLYGGVDYLLAYWLGRYQGYIADDAPATCLQWRPIATTGTQSAGVIENPASGSYQTGIGALTGWYCAAQQLTLQIDNNRPVTVAYGSDRADTAVQCGDRNNGFNFTLNYNALGDGEHTAVLFADGQPVANTTFHVRTLGNRFATGLTGQFVLADFPGAGQSTLLRWQEAQQGFVIAGADGAINPTPAVFNAAAVSGINTPAAYSWQSGIGVIVGWHCHANSVTMRIDQGPATALLTQLDRLDTVAVCGDSNNGFSTLLNYNTLGNGWHQLELSADGVPFALIPFQVQTLGQEFIAGLTGQFALTNFPFAGVATQVTWQEAQQGFVITGLNALSP